MIIDNKRKVVFIHIPKCGGISIENTIHKSLGGEDVITRENLIRIQPRTDVLNCKGLSLHSTLRDYSRYYEERINDFYIFSFVRNPWIRMVSHWEYLINGSYNLRIHELHKLNFSSFVQVYKSEILPHSSFNGYDKYLKDRNNTEINFIGKLENINEDLKKVGLDIKLDLTDVLHMNKTTPGYKLHDDWKKYYNPRTKDMVYEMFKNDIIKFEYDFE